MEDLVEEFFSPAGSIILVRKKKIDGVGWSRVVLFPLCFSFRLLLFCFISSRLSSG